MTSAPPNKPSIAIIGYGKMGKEIGLLAEEYGYPVSAIIDPLAGGCSLVITEESLKDAEVCVVFTAPDQAVANINDCARAGRNMVVGTTGWQREMDEVRRIVDGTGVGLIYASNFSVGVQMFARIVARAAGLLDPLDIYDAAITEMHHSAKRDSPSGTALMLADLLLRNMKRKTALHDAGRDNGIQAHELDISSSRAGSVPGLHTVIFDGPSDSIELIHRAKGRRCFAEGALLAVSWIHGKKGIHTLEEMLDENQSV